LTNVNNISTDFTEHIKVA